MMFIAPMPCHCWPIRSKNSMSAVAGIELSPLMDIGRLGGLLDIERRELRRGEEPIALEPQVFDLLVHLVRNRDRVVSKDDLIQSVWGGRIVSDSALTSRLNAARKAVDDSGAEQRVIRTVQRRGVRFIGEVSEDSEPAAEVVVAPAAAELPTAPRLSIIVLPFANLSDDPEQQYFADGVTGDLMTDLSRIPDM